jgi:hypothetical protein
MKRTNWETATRYVGPEKVVDLSAELAEADLSWLCGCGHAQPFTGSKAYPARTERGSRMRVIDHAALGYRR